MILFFISLIILIAGYFIYGRIVTHFFSPDQRTTPAYAKSDGVDYVPMKTWRVFLIQLLNIAGTGPIFGALMGAVFGPVVFLWIVFGSILGGAVHDYMVGMLSMRMNGATIPDIVGKFLGKNMKLVMRLFSILLLLLVGTVFITSPAMMLAYLTPASLNLTFWVIAIIIYYFLATLLPIDKLIGKIYPVFGVILIIMAVGIVGGLAIGGYTIPAMTTQSLHPQGTPVWPFMFITVACGAISGFHATQSPIMARCIQKEKDGRQVFYGAMIAEGIIALIWAAAGVAFYETTGGLKKALDFLGQSGVVYQISTSLLGITGGILAVIGVVVCPITSGDTAFRSARLIIADWFKMDQTKIKNRLLLSAPLLAVGAILSQVNFNIIWRYFSWSNQTLAMIALWAAAVYLAANGKRKAYAWIAALPATFMSAVTFTYLLMAKEGFGLPAQISYPAGIAFAVALCAFFIVKCIASKNLLQFELDS